MLLSSKTLMSFRILKSDYDCILKYVDHLNLASPVLCHPTSKDYIVVCDYRFTDYLDNCRPTRQDYDVYYKLRNIFPRRQTFRQDRQDRPKLNKFSKWLRLGG